MKIFLSLFFFAPEMIYLKCDECPKNVDNLMKNKINRMLKIIKSKINVFGNICWKYFVVLFLRNLLQLSFLIIAIFYMQTEF